MRSLAPRLTFELIALYVAFAQRDALAAWAEQHLPTSVVPIVGMASETLATTLSPDVFADQSLVSYLCAQPALHSVLSRLVQGSGAKTLAFFQLLHANLPIGEAVTKLDSDIGVSHPSYALFLLLLLRSALERTGRMRADSGAFAAECDAIAACVAAAEREGRTDGMGALMRAEQERIAAIAAQHTRTSSNSSSSSSSSSSNCC